MMRPNKTFMTISAHLESENGSAILMTLLVLVLLTIFGMTSLSTTDSDLQVVSSEREYLQEFFIADSAWKEGGRWLDDQVIPPEEINTADDGIVKNYGDAGADDTNINKAVGTEDGTMSGVPYWYNVTYTTDVIVAGSGPEYRRFRYNAVANADRAQQIQVGLSKIYKIGY